MKKKPSTTRVANMRALPPGKMPADHVYIGRAGRGLDGYFGNPIVPGKKCQICGCYHFGKPHVLGCYEVYLHRRLRDDDAFREKVKSLKGLTLVCFCAPDTCHGDLLAQAADNDGVLSE